MAIDTVVEEVADNLEEMAEATRRINTNSVAFFIGGAAVGAAIGFYFGYRFNKEKIKAEAFKQSEAEVAKIREEYQRKTVAAQPKPSVEDVIEERGYERPLKAPVPVVLVDPRPVTPPPVVTYEGGKDKNQNWDYAEELKHRFASEPYVIHQDEYSANESGYNQVTYTYYAADDVLVDEENGHPLPHGDVVVGVNNLKFGHGTDDIDVVFVRNDKLQLEMEICRSPHSYEQEVLGIVHEESNEPPDPA
jgi:hypothetical protein